MGQLECNLVSPDHLTGILRTVVNGFDPPITRHRRSSESVITFLSRAESTGANSVPAGPDSDTNLTPTPRHTVVQSEHTTVLNAGIPATEIRTETTGHMATRTPKPQVAGSKPAAPATFPAHDKGAPGKSGSPFRLIHGCLTAILTAPGVLSTCAEVQVVSLNNKSV